MAGKSLILRGLGPDAEPTMGSPSAVTYSTNDYLLVNTNAVPYGTIEWLIRGRRRPRQILGQVISLIRKLAHQGIRAHWLDTRPRYKTRKCLSSC